MSDANSEMKYEGLAALIVTQHEAQEKRHEDFMKFVDQRFTGLEEHNRRQNGSITTAINDIAKLKKESNERKLTCGAAVETLQKEVKYTQFVKWIDQHGKTAAVVFIITLLVTQTIVYAAVSNGWLAKIFDLIKGIS